MYDLLIKGGNLFLKGKPTLMGKDIAITDGKIVEVADVITGEAKKTIEADGKVIVPTFMDTHMHIDKAFTMDDDETISLIAACSNSDRRDVEYYGWTDEQIYDFIMKNSSRVVEMCIAHGTTLIKTNLLFTPRWRTIALDVMMDLKKKYAGYCDVMNLVSYPEPFKEELLQATRDGKVDFVAGYPHLTPDHKAITDECFAIAGEFGLPVDLHCDESDVINLDCFRFIIKKTKETHMEGLVTCGHVTGLNANQMPEELANEAIREAAEARMNVTSLTSCNMYLMNATRRGPTRVRQLVEEGVNVAIASDNVRDTFRPFGNCNLIEEALVTAQVHKFGTTEWLQKTMEMITYNAATNAVAKNYGLEVGCKADLNILDAPTPEEAILSRAKALYVLKDGRVIAESGKINREYMK